jgi:hypothetical protein
MNQTELNKIAHAYIETEAVKLAIELGKVITDDIKERIGVLPASGARHLHNLAMFLLLGRINDPRMMLPEEEIPADAGQHYGKFILSMKSSFLDYCEKLQDFDISSSNE